MLQLMLEDIGFNNIVKCRYGYCIFNRNDIYIGQAIEKYGEFSWSEVALFEQAIKPGAFVFDVGSNIGCHTMAFSSIVGKDGMVFAFEPQSVVFQTLCANISMNSRTNVECFQFIVSNRTGFGTLPQIDYSVPANYGCVRADEFDEGNKVQQISIDDYFYDISHIDFMKIDVEGMEKNVLIGAHKTIEKFRPMIYAENDQIDKSAELIETVWELGYKAYWHTPFLFNPRNWAGDQEDIYPGIVSINMLCIPKERTSSMRGFEEVTDKNYHPMQKLSGE